MSSTPFQPRTAVVTIYGGDYLDRIRHLEQRAEALEETIKAAKEDEASQPRLQHEIAESVRLAEEHDKIVDQRDALVAEAEGQATHYRVQHLGRRVWKALTAMHPPRTVEKDKVSETDARSDARSGLNDETFKEALIYGGTVEVNGVPTPYASIVEPEGVTPEELDKLADVDFDRLYLTAFSLNRGMAPDPKASLVPRLTQKNDETSS